MTPALLRALRATGDAGDADAVVAWSAGPLGFEPACVWLAPRCAAAIEQRLDHGDRRAGAWLADVRTHVLSERVLRRRRGREVADLVATRAPFPTSLRASIRQR